MKIILTNCIKIENPTKEMKDFCKKELTFKNPQYDKMRRMGYWAYGTPKEIKLYDEYEGNIYCPMGFFDKLFRFYPVPKDYTDYSLYNWSNTGIKFYIKKTKYFKCRKYYDTKYKLRG